MHGKVSTISHSGSRIFDNIPDNFEATRYHSLVSVEKYFPEDLIITAKTDNNLIMALEHKKLPIYGVQFHPESIMTKYGMKIIENFLKIVNQYKRKC